MLKILVRAALENRAVVLLLAAALMVWGAVVSFRADLDVFPEFVPPIAVVQTEAPGFTAEQVEALVTHPVEAAAAGTLGLETLRSQSIQGLSVVNAIFREGTDLLRARALLAEALAHARLPDGAHPPKLSPPTSSTMDLLKIGFTSERLDATELRTFVDWTAAPRLRAVPGVATVTVFGGRVREIQIMPRLERLAAFDLTLDDLARAARDAAAVRGAGFIDTGPQRLVLQTRSLEPDPRALGATVVAERDGRPVLLDEVADIAEGAVPAFGDGRILGKPGVLVTMLSQMHANTLQVTRAVEDALRELGPVLLEQGIDLYPRLHRPATFIETALGNLQHSLWVGAILVAAILFLFLRDPRTAFISLTAIPLSLLTAVLVLDRLGFTINTITLGGLAIALGEVVDDAIIDVENILRRLRENAAAGSPRTAMRVVLDASLEVRSAVVHATLVVALGFLPVLSLSGLQGKFFAPLGLAYITATLASLATALTVTPALSLTLLHGRAARSSDPAWVGALRRGYAAVVRALCRAGAVVWLAVPVVCALALWRLPSLGGELLPEFREGHFVVHCNFVAGTSLEEHARVGDRIAHAMMEIPEVETVEQQIGRAEMGEDPFGPERSEFHVEMRPEARGKEQEVEDAIRARLQQFPGVRTDVMTFLGDRISETITGETASVVLSVFGDDLDAIDTKAAEAAAVLGDVPGAVDVQAARASEVPQWTVALRRGRLAQYGMRPSDVLDPLSACFQGNRVAETYEGNRVIPISIILPEEARRDPGAVGGLLLRAQSGEHARLDAVADVDLTAGRARIEHEDVRRRSTITCNVDGRDVESFTEEARRLLAKKVSWPKDVYFTFSGEAAASAAARREVLLHTAAAAVGVIALLALAFRSARNLALVLVNLPFAVVGGVAALGAAHLPLSLGALVGFVTLFGISMRNSIMLMSHFEHLVVREGSPWNLDAAVRGATERLSPILMTALVTGLGLLPIALGRDAAGREIEGPMAIVILGGLATSTLLNVLVMPVIALRFARFGGSRN